MVRQKHQAHMMLILCSLMELVIELTVGISEFML